MKNGHGPTPQSSVDSAYDSNTASENSDAQSRRSFLRRSVGLTAVGVPAVVLGLSEKEAYPRGSVLRDPFRSIQQHENDHVSGLVSALGPAARAKPVFKGLKTRSLLRFLSLSRDFENLGVKAYLGAAPVINNSEILASAGSIAVIEARHAGYLNVLLRSPISPMNQSFEQPLGPDAVASTASQFIEELNGPDVTYNPTETSDANDVQILNFALALEYLEAEFYNLNVPYFFG